MKNYIKYEIKGTYKFILGILTILFIAFTLIQFNIYRQINTGSLTNISGGFLMAISFLAIFGAFLTAFFYIVSSFRKELYEDSGFLTFTLPLTGSQILGAKTTVAIIWFLLIGGFTLLYNTILGNLLFGGFWTIYNEILNQVGDSILSISILGIISSILTLLLIYFSMAIGRISIKNKKIGGIWFVIFLILNGLLSYIITKLSGIMPYYVNLNKFQTLSPVEYNLMTFSTDISSNLGIFSNGYFYINISSLLLHLLFIILVFLATSNIIEKRIDL